MLKIQPKPKLVFRKKQKTNKSTKSTKWKNADVTNNTIVFAPKVTIASKSKQTVTTTLLRPRRLLDLPTQDSEIDDKQAFSIFRYGLHEMENYKFEDYMNLNTNSIEFENCANNYFTELKRYHITKFIFMICDLFEYERKTLYLAINLFDRYLAKVARNKINFEIENEDLKLIATSCIMLSAKNLENNNEEFIRILVVEYLKILNGVKGSLNSDHVFSDKTISKSKNETQNKKKNETIENKENCAPIESNNIVQNTQDSQNIYTSSDLFQQEIQICQKLNWQINYKSSPIILIQYLKRILKLDKHVYDHSLFLLDLSFLDYKMQLEFDEIELVCGAIGYGFAFQEKCFLKKDSNRNQNHENEMIKLKNKNKQQIKFMLKISKVCEQSYKDCFAMFAKLFWDHDFACGVPILPECLMVLGG